MPIAIQPFTEGYVQAVREFNARLQAGGVDQYLVFPEDPVPEWLPRLDGCEIRNEYFVAVKEEAVRGAYALKHQPFWIGGETRSIGYYHHPLSEGIVNRAYPGVGISMLADAIRREPLLYALGMEGYDRPLPRMLRSMRWRDWLVPFYFKVNHPARFLRNIEILRGSWPRRLALDAAAWSGAGWLAIGAAQKFAEAKAPRAQPVEVEEIADFGAWADELWEAAKSRYAMAAVRNREALRILFPPHNRKFLRLKVSRQGRVTGWAVVAEAKPNPKYGKMRVGVVLDCFAAPEDAGPVVRASAEALEKRGVDLITSNQSHAAWGAALRHAGFREGPSTFVFAASPQLAELLAPFDENKTRMHFNRSDGDGLYQYL